LPFFCASGAWSADWIKKSPEREPKRQEKGAHQLRPTSEDDLANEKDSMDADSV
jgi:hypothetical protein